MEVLKDCRQSELCAEAQKRVRTSKHRELSSSELSRLLEVPRVTTTMNALETGRHDAAKGQERDLETESKEGRE